MRRYAAIDIGTVTCRLLVVEISDGGEVVELAREVAITNLGEGVDATGLLLPEAIERVRAQILRFQGIIESFSSPENPQIEVVALATSASRDARNAKDFVDMLAESGIRLKVITGEQEAGLSFLGASGAFPGERLLVVDIGGGSTELIVGSCSPESTESIVGSCNPESIELIVGSRGSGRSSSSSIERMHSFDVGCRRVTERFFASDPPSSEELKAAGLWVEATLAPFFGDSFASALKPVHSAAQKATQEAAQKATQEAGEKPFDRVVAVAGTATTVVSVRDGMAVYDSSRVHKSVVSDAELRQVHHKLRSVSLEQRKRIVGLEAKRANVIVAGMVILETVLRLAGASSFTVSEHDILQGIILDAAAKE